MKRVISLLLSIVVLLSITAGLDLSAYAANATSSQIVSYAKSFEGYPYVLNTHGPNSFDCSGFVYYVFKHYGITLSTGTTEYWNNPTKYGTKVTGDANAKPGDVCVWSGHVGIYIGSGVVMNALNPSSGVCKTTISKYINSSGTMNPSHFYLRVNGIDYSSTTNDTSGATTAKITFNGNGGTPSVSSLTVTVGKTMGSTIPTATRYGYIFDGWYTASTGGTRYTNSTAITSGNKTLNLYAHWISVSSNGVAGNLTAGRLYRIINKKSGYALQPDSDSNGALVKQQAVSDTYRQIWRLSLGGGCIFKNAYGGKCLDIKGQSLANGAELQLYGTDDNSQDNRIFSLVSRGSGYYSIHPNHSGRVLDIRDASTSTGAQVQQYYYTGNNQQLFSFQEVTNRNVQFYDNLSNNYLPTPREVYNHSGGSTPKDCYTSRNTDYLTTTVNAVQNKLTITSKKAGSSGNDMEWSSSINGSYNYELYDSNTNTMYLCFTAKSSVQGAKMYFRWGYDSASTYKSITLNTTAANYIIELPRTLNSGRKIHPYIDRACTVEITNIQLKSSSTASVDLSSGDTFSYQSINYNINNNSGTYGSLPQPTSSKSGYVFAGWYTDRIGGTKVTANTKLGYNTRLYAHWTKDPVYDVWQPLQPLEHICTYDNGKVTKQATCTSAGVKTYTCTICGETKTETIAKTAHTYKNYVTKATTSKNGSIVNKCSECGAKKSSSVIYYPKTITLSATSYTYDGKVKKPSVKVVGSNGKTISASNYTVSYSSGRKNVGKYTVTIKFNGNYSGTVKKTFTIKPKNTSISKITAKSKGFTVKWKKYTTQTTGYQIQYSTSSKFTNAKTVTISKNSTTSKTISKLKGKKKYYVRIRTYKTVSGTKYYSSWSKAKTVTTKK